MKTRVSDAFELGNGSAGARSTAQMITNEEAPLSRYRAGKLMAELDLVSYQPPHTGYKKAEKPHDKIANTLYR